MARSLKVGRLKCFQSARMYLNFVVVVVEAGGLAEVAGALDFAADLVVEEEVDLLRVAVGGEDLQHTRTIEPRALVAVCCML